ncbi:MAG TPA: HEAT repeat domain-containing protein [Kofleriaceae bacterium]|nr:HEAT repeat domain-containing protein [Kofleriaceae bacterium]
MARRLEERLAEVHAIAGDPSPSALPVLRDALRSKTGLLVGAAAAVVAEAELGDLVEELPAAFARLLERPIERDPGCRGKVALVRALHKGDRWEEEVFARGVRHVQREPAFGGSVDTAAVLRGTCGIAYAHFNRSEAIDILAELLADPEQAARAGAAQGLGDSGRADAIPLLRFKALVGDPEPAVMSACFSALLALAADSSLSFLARFLAPDRTEESAEVAALALGESRLDAAFPLLRAWCDDGMPARRAQVGYLALALLRLDPATDHLLGIVAGGDPGEAVAAASALATFRADPGLAERVLEAAGKQPDRKVAAEVRAAFAPR